MQELIDEAKAKEGEWLAEIDEDYGEDRLSTLGENVSKNLFGDGSE